MILMIWEEELENLLARLGVQQDQGDAEQQATTQEEEPDLVDIHRSISHPGVSYRLELRGTACHVYIYAPIDEGPYRLRVFHAQLASSEYLAHLFALYLSHEGGSLAFHEARESCTYQLFRTLADLIKRLFWQGNLETMSFPPEIDVRCLL